MITISPIRHKILKNLWGYKFLTAKQLWKLGDNRSLQEVYKGVRWLRDMGLLGSIIYGGVSRSGTMQQLHYLNRKWAILMAESERISLDGVKFPKSTNSLVKNDFLHRIATIDLIISFDQRIFQTGYTKLFFDVYFDTLGSQKGKTDGALRSKTRLDLDRQHFIAPDWIFAFEGNEGTRLFVLEVVNEMDSKSVVEQISKNLFASYKGLVGDKYHIPQTATILMVFQHPELLKSTLQRIAKDPHLQRFEKIEEYLFFGLQSYIGSRWASPRINIHGKAVEVFS